MSLENKIPDILSFEKRRELAEKLLADPKTSALIDNIVKHRINPGFIVSFNCDDERVTGIVSSMCFEMDKYDIVACAKIVPFSEWGKMPEFQELKTYRKEDMKNYVIISDGKPKE